MKINIITFVGSFFIGGFVSLMMVRSVVKSDQEYTLQQLTTVSDKINKIQHS